MDLLYEKVLFNRKSRLNNEVINDHSLTYPITTSAHRYRLPYTTTQNTQTRAVSLQLRKQTHIPLSLFACPGATTPIPDGVINSSSLFIIRSPLSPHYPSKRQIRTAVAATAHSEAHYIYPSATATIPPHHYTSFRGDCLSNITATRTIYFDCVFFELSSSVKIHFPSSAFDIVVCIFFSSQFPPAAIHRPHISVVYMHYSLYADVSQGGHCFRPCGAWSQNRIHIELASQ